MTNRLLLFGVLLLLAGCCRNRCNPCPRRCDVYEPSKPKPRHLALSEQQESGVIPLPGAPCATWDLPECPNGMARPVMLDMIRGLAEAAHVASPPSISPAQFSALVAQLDLYSRTRPCLGSLDNGPGDCCPPGMSNCQCLQVALQAAQFGNWPLCTTRLEQGH